MDGREWTVMTASNTPPGTAEPIRHGGNLAEAR